MRMVTWRAGRSGGNTGLLLHRAGLLVEHLRRLVERQGHGERRPLPRHAVRAARAAVPLRDLPAQRQPDARPRVLGAAVQALEDAEDAARVLRLEADPVVA